MTAGLTPTQAAHIVPWTQRWIANAMRTAPLVARDRARLRRTLRGLYRAAALEPPPPDRIIIVPSPFAVAFAGRLAAARWSVHATQEIPPVRTWTALGAATAQAVRAATTGRAVDAPDGADRNTGTCWDTVPTAIQTAVVGAIRDSVATLSVDAQDETMRAVGAAVKASTRAATFQATEDAVWIALDAVTTDPEPDEHPALVAPAGPPETARWWTGVDRTELRALASACLPEAPAEWPCQSGFFGAWDGGNQWSGEPAWISFLRDVVQLPAGGVAWRYYETACQLGGPRVAHRQFCLVSERPVRLSVDAQHRPHSADGPFCLWADGTALWAWHGVRVPAWVVQQPERITVATIEDAPNAELRRVLLERFGVERFVQDIGALPVHTDHYGTLYRVALPGDEPLVLVRLTNSTPEIGQAPGLVQAPDGSWRKQYWLRVPPDVRTAREAVAWSFHTRPDEYRPAIET